MGLLGPLVVFVQFCSPQLQHLQVNFHLPHCVQHASVFLEDSPPDPSESLILFFSCLPARLFFHLVETAGDLIVDHFLLIRKVFLLQDSEIGYEPS